MTNKNDTGPDVQPLGRGGSYIIDPATGRPVAPVTAPVPGATPAAASPHETTDDAAVAHPAKKPSSKETSK